MKRTLLIATIIAATTALTTSAFAANQGFFVDANGGYSQMFKLNPTPPGKIKKSGFAFDLGLGYMFNQYFGLKLAGYRFAPLKVSGAKIQPYTAAAEGVFSIPFGQSGFSFYGEGGLGYSIIKASGSSSKTKKSFQPIIGAGFEYAFNHNIAVQLGDTWTRIKSNSNKADINYIHAGLVFTFGSDSNKMSVSHMTYNNQV